MAKNPTIQSRAQREIDRVVGTERLPNLNDCANLPYIKANFKELLRFSPSLPLGKQIDSIFYNSIFYLSLIWFTFSVQALPHSVTQDDFYHHLCKCLVRFSHSSELVFMKYVQIIQGPHARPLSIHRS